MADFVSHFWSILIIVATVGGIAWLIFLLYSNSRLKLKPGEEAKATGHVWDENLEELNTPLPRWWAGMFYITIIFSAGYLFLYPGLGSYTGSLGWSQINQYEEEVTEAGEKYDPLFKQYAAQDVKQLATDEAAMKTGKRLFSTYCSVCHGSDARGAKGFPNLRDADWLWGNTPEQIKVSIGQGRTGVMPAWKASLGDDGVDEVATYVMSLSGRKVDADKAAKGKARFAACSGCHGVEGKGNPALGAPNLTDKTWLYGASPKAIKQIIAEGKMGKMPAHDAFLGSDRVHVLTAYIYSISNTK